MTAGMGGYAPPPKKKMSTTAKVLIGLAIAFGVFILVGALGAVVCAVACRSYMNDSMNTDPAQVQSATEAVADLAVPEGMEPVMSMDMRIPFSNQRAFLMVAYADTRPIDPATGGLASMIVIGSSGDSLGPEARDGMRQGMNNALSQNGLSDEQGQLTFTDRREIERQVNGEPAHFVLQHGRHNGSGRAVIRVDGNFEGRMGPAVISMVLDAERFPEPTVVAIVDSIR